MTPTSRPRPISRLRVVAGALCLLAVLAGVAALAETLRHPATIDPVPEPFDAADPRDDLVCEAPPGGSEPLDVQSDVLYDCPHLYDGRTVRFRGEVVGALLRRDDGAWTQLNDDAYAGDLGPLPAHREFRGGNAGVGVHLPHALADRINSIGSHTARGDVLTVVGTYHQSDTDSGEVAVIRASRGTITAGSAVAHQRLRDRQVVGLGLGAAALGLLAAAGIRRRRR